MKTKIAENDGIIVPPAVIEAALSQDRVDNPPHSFYKYPARFSPVFAREAIKAFTTEGETVIDPFCGGGTSLVEAVALGRRAAGFGLSENVESPCPFHAHARSASVDMDCPRTVRVCCVRVALEVAWMFHACCADCCVNCFATCQPDANPTAS
jgi:DNA methylase